MIRRRTMLSVGSVLLIAGLCGAEIIGVAGGWGPPGKALGPYQMTRFPLDERPLHEYVTYVPSPLGGQIDFSVPVSHVRVGQGWGGGWHGYEGDVYVSYDPAVTLHLPNETRAFYFYASQWADYEWITAVTDDGTSIGQLSHPGGALYFGFYQDDPAGPPIEWIEVACPTSGMVVVGELAIAIPAPGALALAGVGAIGAGGRRRRR